MKKLLYMHGGSYNHGCEAIVRSTLKIIDAEKTTKVLSYSIDEDINFGLGKECKVDHNCLPILKRSLRYFILAAFNKLIKTNINYLLYFAPFRKQQFDNTVALSVGGDNYCYPGSPNLLDKCNKFIKKQKGISVLWGCSIDPDVVNSNVEQLKVYDLITARESITYQALIKNGITKNTRLYPDPAFVLEKSHVSIPKHFQIDNTIGINISPHSFNYAKNSNITRHCLEHLIEYLLENTNYSIAFISHVEKRGNSDAESMNSFYSKYKSSNRIIKINGHYNCMELKGIISQCRMFVGARTHATIAAYSTNVPTLVMGYSVKSKGIAKDIFGTYENYVVPVQELKDVDELTNAFKWLSQNEDRIRRHLQNYMPGYIEKAWKAGEEVKRLIEVCY